MKTASTFVLGRHRAYGLDDHGDDWRTHARCGLTTAYLFEIASNKGTYQSLTADNRAGLALCRACPVATACLKDALEHPDVNARIAGGHVVLLGHIRPTAPPPKDPQTPRKGHYPRGPSPATVWLHHAILGLHEQGLARHAIADKLGVNYRTVQRHLAKAAK